MREIWWVRHGPTHMRALVGWSDVPADLGDTAALARLSEALPDAPVVSSDLSRAVATADAIQRGRPRLPHIAGLREINFGAWELRTATELEAEDPDTSRRYWTDPTDIRPPGGESFRDLSARVDAALTALEGHKRLIVVAHFGVILSQVQRARGVTVPEALAQRIDPLSLTETRQTAAGWSAGRVNFIA